MNYPSEQECVDKFLSEVSLSDMNNLRHINELEIDRKLELTFSLKIIGCSDDEVSDLISSINLDNTIEILNALEEFELINVTED